MTSAQVVVQLWMGIIACAPGADCYLDHEWHSKVAYDSQEACVETMRLALGFSVRGAIDEKKFTINCVPYLDKNPKLP